MHTASALGKDDIVLELLGRGANVEATDNEGSTSLILASIYNNATVVRALLARGANIEAADVFGATPLIRASEHGCIGVVRVLLAAGADKSHVANNGDSAASIASTEVDEDEPADPDVLRDAIRAVLAAAPP